MKRVAPSSSNLAPPAKEPRTPFKKALYGIYDDLNPKPPSPAQAALFGGGLASGTRVPVAKRILQATCKASSVSKTFGSPNFGAYVRQSAGTPSVAPNHNVPSVGVQSTSKHVGASSSVAMDTAGGDDSPFVIYSACQCPPRVP